MYPHSYSFVTEQRPSADTRCCAACAGLDARRVATEPHTALSQTAEHSHAGGREIHYTCDACDARWTRFLKTRHSSRRKAFYWQLVTKSFE
jgi:hypothetical protein